MSLLSAISDTIDGLFRAAPGPPGSSTLSGGWYGGPYATDAYGAKKTPAPAQLVEAYKSLIYACVQINDNAVTRVPLRLYADSAKPGGMPRSACEPRSITRSEWQRLKALPYLRSLIGGSDQTHEINVHPMLEMLDAPDPDGYFDRQSLLSLIVRYVDVVGIAYNKPDGGQPPAYFWPLASQYVLPVPVGNSPLIARYTYFGDTYEFDELVRFRLTPSLKDPYKAGYCATYAALQYAGLEDEWVSIQQNTLSNGARPSMLVASSDATMPLQEQTARRLEQSLDMNHARGNSGRPLVVRDAVTATPMNWPPGDLAGLEISKNMRECVANCFGVPTEYLTGDRNLANLQAAREYHAANAVEPRCKMIAAVLTRMVRKYDPRLFFAFDAAVPEDEERRTKINVSLTGAAVRTINEVRAEMNLAPVPYGDEPWMAGTLKQPTMLAEAHQQGLETAKQTLENQTKATEFQYSEGDDDDPGAADAGGGGGGDGDTDRSVPAFHAGAVERRFDEILDAIEDELGIDRGHGGNPNHVASGEHGGEFTSGPGGAGHGKHWAKRQRRKKRKPKKSKTATGGGKAKDTRVKIAKKETGPKDESRAGRAREAYDARKSGVDVQRYGERQEVELIKKIGGTQGSDNGSVDVVRKVGGFDHGLEVKTLINKGGPNKSGTKAQIKMMPDQLARKQAWLAQAPNRRSGVIVMDHRDRAASESGEFIGNKEAWSGHDLYYRRDYGAHTIGGMYPVKSATELKGLMAKSDDELREMVKSDPKRYKGLIKIEKAPKS